MSNKKIDIIEIFIKNDLDIPLENEEIEWLNNLDDETKKAAIELINNNSYIDEIVKILNKIIIESKNLSDMEQENIKEKCEVKRLKLLYEDNSNNKATYK